MSSSIPMHQHVSHDGVHVQVYQEHAQRTGGGATAARPEEQVALGSPAPPGMISGLRIFLLGPVSLSEQEWNSDPGVTISDIHSGQGLRIAAIDEGCSLWQSGVRNGDCITAVNGVQLLSKDPHTAFGILIGPQPSTVVTLHVLRGLPPSITDRSAVCQAELVLTRHPTEGFGFQTAQVCVESRSAEVQSFEFAQTGLPIFDVSQPSPAAAGGLLAGDVIVAINGAETFGHPASLILQAIAGAQRSKEAMDRFDKVAFGGEVMRAVSAEDGQELIHVVFLIRRRLWESGPVMVVEPSAAPSQLTTPRVVPPAPQQTLHGGSIIQIMLPLGVASLGFTPAGWALRKDIDYSQFTTAKTGVLVVEVLPHSPAAVAGIVTGDVIVAVNGRDTSSYLAAHVISMLRAGAAHASNQGVPLSIEVVHPHSPVPSQLLKGGKSGSSGYNTARSAGGGSGAQHVHKENPRAASMTDTVLLERENASEGWGIVPLKIPLTPGLDVSAFSYANEGVVVQRCIPGSPADRAFIAAGSVLTHIGGKRLLFKGSSDDVYAKMRPLMGQLNSLEVTLVRPHKPPPFGTMDSNTGAAQLKLGKPSTSPSKDGEYSTSNSLLGPAAGTISPAVSGKLASGVSIMISVTSVGMGFTPAKIMISPSFEAKFTAAKYGLLVHDVSRTGSAAAAGMQTGDVITAVGGISLQSYSVEDAIKLLRSASDKALQEGAMVSMTVVHPHGPLPSGMGDGVTDVTSLDNAQLSKFELFEKQFTRVITVAGGTAMGFVPATKMLPPPQHDASYGLGSATDLPIKYLTPLQDHTFAVGGLPVSAVTFGSPSALAGLEKGDVIVAVNSSPVRTQKHDKVLALIRQAAAAGNVNLQIVKPHTPLAGDVDVLLGGKEQAVQTVAALASGNQTDEPHVVQARNLFWIGLIFVFLHFINWAIHRSSQLSKARSWATRSLLAGVAEILIVGGIVCLFVFL